MRVTTGSAKGRKLVALPDQNIRPTTDFIKQAIFNSIQHDIEGRRVLDLFAGSGQMGIEALSRGAVFADFIDRDRAAVEIVKKNIEHCGLSDRACVHNCDASAFLKRPGLKYDLIFLDPPYRSKQLEHTLREIIRIDILRIGGIIICEYAEGKSPDAPPPYTIKGRRVYGGKAVTFFTKTDGSAVL